MIIERLPAGTTPKDFELALPRGRSWRIGPRPAIMGILNLTPDSFSDGGSYAGPEEAVERGLEMLAEGADVLDLGGESTRPGAEDVSAEAQIERVLPVLRGLRGRTDAPLSVDTRSPRVGEVALEAGADIINDVSGLARPGWIPLLSKRPVPIVLMHMRGTPRDMQKRARYPGGVVAEVRDWLERRLSELSAAGIARERFLVDPGIGFAKEARHNLEVLRELSVLNDLGRPVLIGASRKFFLGKLLGGNAYGRGREPRDRDIGTVAANMVALLQGASVLRVHNVPYTRDLVDVFQGLVLAGVSESPVEPGGRAGARSEENATR